MHGQVYPPFANGSKYEGEWVYDKRTDMAFIVMQMVVFMKGSLKMVKEMAKAIRKY